MVPSSTNEPSGNRSTRESSTAVSPARGSTLASTPSVERTARSAWLGAVVRARRSEGEPGTAPARPLNSSAKTSSRIGSEDDEAARQLAGGERAEGLVGLVEPVAPVDELVDAQPAGQVEAHEGRQILARARAAIGGAADLALRRHHRAHVERDGRAGFRHADEDANPAGSERLQGLRDRTR